MSQKLPFSHEMERDILGMVLSVEECRDKLIPELSETLFHHGGHLTLWKQIHALFVQQKPINDVMVMDAMRENGTLNTLCSADMVLTCAREGDRYFGNWTYYYPDMLVKLDTYRQARVAVIQATAMLEGAWACNLEAMQSCAEEVLRATTTSEKKRKGKTWKESGKEWIKRDMTKLKGVSTGFRWLDEKLGGLRRQNLLVIAGGASDGKTSLALNIAINAANEGNHVALFSQEMGLDENWERGLAYEKTVRSGAIMNGIMNPREYKGLEEYCLEDKPIYAYDDCATLEEIEAEVRLCVAKHNTRVVVVDYLQIVDGDKKLNREQEVAEVGKRLKQLAKRFQITVIAMSQLNDDGKARESRTIKMHADQMLTILVKEDDDTSRCLKIEKNRGGKRYIKCEYKFEGEFFTFHEIGEIEDKKEDPKKKNGHKPRAVGQFP